ncbi:MAG: putative protein YccU [Rhodocyclaceae bacterium]|nr:putative protein YccU [Rhodocyclaceae bacterium]
MCLYNAGMFQNPPLTEIAALLASMRVLAVVGLSPNPSRPSYGVARALQNYGIRIIPVHPSGGEVLGERACATLDELPCPVDMVDVFRRPEHVASIVDDCIRLRLPRLWLQDGVVDTAAAARARAAGIMVVMDRCVLRDYHALCRQ